MSRTKRSTTPWLLVLGLLTTGCFGPKGPEKAKFDPKKSAELAMSSYDSNSDSVIDEKEVEASPGLKSAFERIDKDKDGKLTAAEIEERVAYYKATPSALSYGRATVFFRNQPLPGATVTFEPEAFLGESFSPCVGETDETGIASLQGPNSEFPGIYLGFYRVRISRLRKDKEEIPAKYNTETILGYEARDDDFSGRVGTIEFNLK